MTDKNYVPWLMVFGFLGAFGFLFWGTINGMVMQWSNDENYSHGFIIPLVSGYLVWMERERLAGTPLRSSPGGLLLLLFGLFVFLAGYTAQIEFVERLALWLVLGGALLYALGGDMFKKTWFPYVYLLFMIPLPYVLYDSIAFPLKLFITEYSVVAVKMMGIPVLREGNIIHLTNTTLEVADACSGIRSIISLLALSTALAYFTQNGWLKKTVLVLLAFPIAVIANSIRVIGTAALAHSYGADVARGFFHEFAGLAIFALAFVMLLGSAAALKKIGGRRHG